MTIDHDRRDTGRPRRGAAPPAVTAVAATAVAVLAACSGGSGDAAEADGPGTDPASEGGGGTARIINVEVEPVAPEPFVERIRITGEVEADRDVVISAEESGPVREIFVEKGSVVRAGDRLFKLDDAVLAPQVEEARARASLARETWERRRELYENDRALSELQYLEAKYEAEQAAARLETLEARLRKTVVRAPVTGIFEERFVEEGTLVSPGTRLARILDIREVKVTGGVPERYAGDVAPGAPATVTLQALGGRSYEGEVAFVGSAVDEQSRTFTIEVRVPNPGASVKPRMVADVEVVRKRWDDAITVPQEALVRISDGFIVYVAAEGEDGNLVARTRSVETGPKARNRVLVRSGLEPGDHLVVVGQQRISGGDRVRIVNDAAGEER